MAAISLRGDFDEPMLWALVLGEKTGERLQTPALSRDDSWRLVRGSGEEYLLRTNLTNQDPAVLWQYYVQLVWFKNLKGDLAIRQIFHKDERRIEAHIFVDFHLLEFRCRLAGLRGARQECPPRRSRRRHLACIIQPGAPRFEKMRVERCIAVLLLSAGHASASPVVDQRWDLHLFVG